MRKKRQEKLAEAGPGNLILISDSTGDLGERVLRALISQFPKDSFILKVYRFISSDRDLETVAREISELRPIVFHTTLSLTLKRRIETLAGAHRFPVHDITGGTMEFLEKSSGRKSVENTTTLHPMNTEYDRRIAALNFTVEHDDSLGEDTWDQADVILCGVSRTSKTPTSIYLANKGYKVANIPIINDIPIPQRLFENPRLPLVGLDIDLDRLREIRLRRAKEENIPSERYSDAGVIAAELDKARLLFAEVGCPIIDVTHRAVEEVAALIQKKMRLNNSSD